MAGGCKITSQSCMLIIGLVFWGAAAGFIYVGTYVFQSYGHYKEIAASTYTLIPASISIAIGGIMFFTGILGCCGAFNKNRCLLSTFFLLLLVIFSFEVAAGILGYVHRDEVEISVKDGLFAAINKYGANDSITDQVDFMQNQFTCCGVMNYTDWTNTSYGHDHPELLPLSCCAKPKDHSDERVCSTNETHSTHFNLPVHTDPCFKEMEDKFKEYFAYIAIVATTFAVVQVIGMISACVLFWQKRDILPYSNLSGSGFTV